MARTDDTLPVTDIKVTVEGLLPKGGGALTAVFILTSVIACASFVLVMVG